jgi:hypothetical protein
MTLFETDELLTVEMRDRLSQRPSVKMARLRFVPLAAQVQDDLGHRLSCLPTVLS